MTFLAPVWLAIAGAAAAVVIGLHILARHRPPPEPFPTARFIPSRPARAMTRTLRLSDVPLLALRVLLLLLIGAALARPLLPPSREAVARVVVLDRSRAVGNAAEARDSALALLGDGDVLVLADSAASIVAEAPRDSLAAGAGTVAAPASLSAALIAARRAAASLRERADSVEIVVVSPLVHESIDPATDSIRARWPGAIRLVRIGPANESPTAPPVVRAPDGDPVAVAASLHLTRASAGAGGGGARVVRDTVTASDSAFARAGGALVVWSADPEAQPDAVVDTIGGVWSGATPVIAPFARIRIPDGERAVAWWVDGRVAAAERAVGRGCIRDVAIPVPVAGDLALRPEFGALVRALAAPCGGARDLRPLDSAAVERLAGSAGQMSRVASARIAGRAGGPTPLAAWLLGGALLLAALEPLIRRARGEESP